MKKLIILLFATFVVSTLSLSARRVRIPIGSEEVLEKVASLPTTEKYQIPDTNPAEYFQLARRYLVFKVLGLPIWVEDEPVLILIQEGNWDSYWDFPEENVAVVMEDIKGDEDNFLSLPFFIRFGGKLIILGLLLGFALVHYIISRFVKRFSSASRSREYNDVQEGKALKNTECSFEQEIREPKSKGRQELSIKKDTNLDKQEVSKPKRTAEKVIPKVVDSDHSCFEENKKTESKEETQTEDMHCNEYVAYEVPSSYLENDLTSYWRGMFPEKGTILFPYRRGGKRNIRGYMEESFQKDLTFYSNSLPVKVLGKISVHLFDNSRAYEPDIAIVCTGLKKIYIDVEIDEPYSGYTREPIHYIGCGDRFRDESMTGAGWIVLRFYERQIKESPKSVLQRSLA